MSDGIPAKAREYLARPGFAGLWRSLRKRLENNELAIRGWVVVELDYEAAEDVSGLLGRLIGPGRARVSLTDLDAALRSSAVAHGLVTVVGEMTGGPLTDRKAVSRTRREQKLDVWARWEAAIADSGLDAAPWVSRWQEGVRRAGLISRAGNDVDTVIRRTVAVLRALSETIPLGDRDATAMAEALPAAPSFELSELAGRACSDAHALDEGQLTAALVLRALAAATGESVPKTSVARRELWALSGVTPDRVSGTVMAWSVRPPGEHLWARSMRDRADLGLVSHVTLQEWHAAADRLWAAPGEQVFACENPQVLQAAARADVKTPLLCTSGNPATVALRVIDCLIAGGAVVRYHGDFDTAGVRIAKRLFERGVRPWRYAVEDYLASIDRARLPLTGTVPVTPWSPGLASAMEAHQLAVHEEALLDVLLDDLASGSAAQWSLGSRHPGM
ncbi:TIGR02679 family protein [Amycolatopsis sp. lyj-84]|uniref:TIGR02679 family protein n=1 Tax=Amycolatopsis sp. lyj-84 TaxID=2789284 RepID=UPI0039788DE9